MEDLLRLRQVSPGAQLLPRLRLAGRICRRLPVALHQRTRPRQHPEGWNLFGRSAHVGRNDVVEGAAGDRRRRRQVCDPRRQGNGRPAHRHARHQEGRSARGLGRSRQGRLRLRSGLCQGPAHGKDLCRHRLVPLRHAGFHRARHPHRKVHVGFLDPGQAQDGRLRLSPKLASKFTLPAPPGSTSREPRCSGS